MVDALQRLIRESLDWGSELAWGRLLSFSYWGLGRSGESCGVRKVSLSMLVRQQVSRFMKALIFRPSKSLRGGGTGPVEGMRLLREE